MRSEQNETVRLVSGPSKFGDQRQMVNKIVGLKSELRQQRELTKGAVWIMQNLRAEIERLNSALRAERQLRHRDTAILLRAHEKTELSEQRGLPARQVERRTNASLILESQHGGSPEEFAAWREEAQKFVNGKVDNV